MRREIRPISLPLCLLCIHLKCPHLSNNVPIEPGWTLSRTQSLRTQTWIPWKDDNISLPPLKGPAAPHCLLDRPRSMRARHNKSQVAMTMSGSQIQAAAVSRLSSTGVGPVSFTHLHASKCPVAVVVYSSNPANVNFGRGVSPELRPRRIRHGLCQRTRL